MTTEEVRTLVTAALADPSVDLAAPLGMPLMLREGCALRSLPDSPAGTTTRPSATYREACPTATAIRSVPSRSPRSPNGFCPPT